MPEDNLEETLETSPAEEIKEPATELDAVQESEPEKDQELEKLNKQLYERAKKAEAKAKEYEKILKTTPPAGVEKFSSVDAILEIQRATRGLDEDEVAELRLRAKATGKSLLDARKDDNFLLWQTARRQKVEKEKTLEPSSRQGESDNKNGPPGPNASLGEIEEYWTKFGLLKPHGTPPSPKFTPRL